MTRKYMRRNDAGKITRLKDDEGPAPPYEQRQRKDCLKCDKPFWSRSAINRLCVICLKRIELMSTEEESTPKRK